MPKRKKGKKKVKRKRAKKLVIGKHQAAGGWKTGVGIVLGGLAGASLLHAGYKTYKLMKGMSKVRKRLRNRNRFY